MLYYNLSDDQAFIFYIESPIPELTIKSKLHIVWCDGCAHTLKCVKPTTYLVTVQWSNNF